MAATLSGVAAHRHSGAGGLLLRRDDARHLPLAHPAVSAVLTGARSEAEFRDNLAMFEMPLPPDLRNALEAPANA